MRVCLLALPSDVGRAEANLAGLDRELAAAGACDLAVVAEAFGQGFDAITDDGAHDVAIGWDAEGPEIERVRDLARRHGCAICLGFIERDGDMLHSSAIVVDHRGSTVSCNADCRRAGGPPMLTRRCTSRVLTSHVLNSVDAESPSRCAGICGSCPTALPDLVLWPVFLSYTPRMWEGGELVAYAQQAGSVARQVALVNSLASPQPGASGWSDAALGGAAWFVDGQVVDQLPMGQPGHLIIDACAPAGTHSPTPKTPDHLRDCRVRCRRDLPRSTTRREMWAPNGEAEACEALWPATAAVLIHQF